MVNIYLLLLFTLHRVMMEVYKYLSPKPTHVNNITYLPRSSTVMTTGNPLALRTSEFWSLALATLAEMSLQSLADVLNKCT